MSSIGTILTKSLPTFTVPCLMIQPDVSVGREMRIVTVH
jgi:hypothetical protein